MLHMSLAEYAVLAFSSLLVIVDPLATVPAFLAMTPGDTAAERTRMAALACWVASGVLLVFAVAGKYIFQFLGITMPAFQMAASIVLLLVALDMLKAQRSRVLETSEETAAGAAKTDIAITPLAIPMLAGPGAISTVILLRNKAESPAHQLALATSVLAVTFLSYVVLRLSARGAKWLSPIALSITTRVMGLLLAAISMQFILNAARELGVPWIKPVM
jgi:multiple antibiotic resistance protein